jgi:hypothetical protein
MKMAKKQLVSYFIASLLMAYKKVIEVPALIA